MAARRNSRHQCLGAVTDRLCGQRRRDIMPSMTEMSNGMKYGYYTSRPQMREAWLHFALKAHRQ